MSRKSAPWYRKARRMFYGNVGGKQVGLGVTDPADLAGAWAVLKRLVEASGGTDGGPVANPTLAEVAAAWLTDRAPEVKPDTLRNYRRMLKPVLAHFGTVRLHDVIPGQVEAFAAGKGWSDTHRCNVLLTVEQAMRFGGRRLKFRKPRRESAGAESVIPEPVHEKVLLVTRGDWRQIIRFLWLTGCRPGEAAGLTADAVDWPSGVVRIREHKTKRHGKTRQLFLCPEALAVLREQKDRHGGGLLFRGKAGRPFSQMAFVMKFGRISERVGHKVTSYGYRHTYATRALLAGESDVTVAALLGHSGTTMLHRHYSHITEQARHLKDAAARLSTKPPGSQAG